MNLLEINPDGNVTIANKLKIGDTLDVAGDMKAEKDIEVRGQIKGSRFEGNGSNNGALTISGNVDFVGTVQVFSGPQNVQDWTPVEDLSFFSSQATQDGFLSVVVELTDRNNTVCFVEGVVNGQLMGAASVNGVANLDFPIWKNSFMMPVPKGADWKVRFSQDEKTPRSYPIIRIRWTPLGR